MASIKLLAVCFTKILPVNKKKMASNREDVKRIHPEEIDEYLANIAAMLKIAEYKNMSDKEKLIFFAEMAQNILLSRDIEDNVVRHRLYQIMERAERLRN